MEVLYTIIEAIMTVFMSIFDLIFSAIPDVPDLPPDLEDSIPDYVELLVDGVEILNQYLYGEMIEVLLGLTVAALVAYYKSEIAQEIYDGIPFFRKNI